jgi:hypothetical protein
MCQTLPIIHPLFFAVVGKTYHSKPDNGLVFGRHSCLSNLPEQLLLGNIKHYTNCSILEEKPMRKKRIVSPGAVLPWMALPVTGIAKVQVDTKKFRDWPMGGS